MKSTILTLSLSEALGVNPGAHKEHKKVHAEAHKHRVAAGFFSFLIWILCAREVEVCVCVWKLCLNVHVLKLHLKCVCVETVQFSYNKIWKSKQKHKTPLASPKQPPPPVRLLATQRNPLLTAVPQSPKLVLTVWRVALEVGVALWLVSRPV